MTSTIPPVVQRIREKRVSETQLREFVAQQFPSREKIGGFRELIDRSVGAVQSHVVRFVGIPEDDPYWNSALRDQNLMSALGTYLLSQVEAGQADESLLWALAGLAVDLRCDNEFGREYWHTLVLRDLQNIRWLVESALWVWLNSGCDTSDAVYRSQVHLARDRKGVY